MILITGSTGHLGRATIDFLLNKIPANQIVALVRDAAKAEDIQSKGIELRIGDYNNYASLANAFIGIDKLFLISSSEIGDRAKQHYNVIDAAKEAGVKHVIYTSFQRKSDAGSPIQAIAQSHIDTENYLRNSGLTYTILKNGLYADILPMFMGEKVLETGIFFPAGSGRANFTARVDMAEAASHILAGSGHENREYQIASDKGYTFDDIASELSSLSGKPISYSNPERQVYMDTLLKVGVPAEYAGMFASFSEAIKEGEFESDNNDLERLIGRKPTSMSAYLKSIYFSNN